MREAEAYAQMVIVWARSTENVNRLLPLAAAVVLGKGLDLARHRLDVRVEATPVFCKVGYQMHWRGQSTFVGELKIASSGLRKGARPCRNMMPRSTSAWMCRAM